MIYVFELRFNCHYHVPYPPNCRPFNSRLVLQLAKQNVEREYAVVGTWEHTNETLAVLEAYVPRYFANASKMYYCK